VHNRIASLHTPWFRVLTTPRVRASMPARVPAHRMHHVRPIDTDADATTLPDDSADSSTSSLLWDELPRDLLAGTPHMDAEEVAATQAAAAAAMECAWRGAGHAGQPSRGWACNVRASIVNHFGVRRVVFFAQRDICKDEELCYDYGDEFKKYHRATMIMVGPLD
jgi:hypothetical protein